MHARRQRACRPSCRPNRLEDLPAEAVDHANVFILDTAAVAAVLRSDEASHIAAEAMIVSGGVECR